MPQVQGAQATGPQVRLSIEKIQIVLSTGEFETQPLVLEIQKENGQIVAQELGQLIKGQMPSFTTTETQQLLNGVEAKVTELSKGLEAQGTGFGFEGGSGGLVVAGQPMERKSTKDLVQAAGAGKADDGKAGATDAKGGAAAGAAGGLSAGGALPVAVAGLGGTSSVSSIRSYSSVSSMLASGATRGWVGNELIGVSVSRDGKLTIMLLAMKLTDGKELRINPMVLAEIDLGTTDISTDTKLARALVKARGSLTGTVLTRIRSKIDAKKTEINAAMSILTQKTKGSLARGLRALAKVGVLSVGSGGISISTIGVGETTLMLSDVKSEGKKVSVTRLADLTSGAVRPVARVEADAGEKTATAASANIFESMKKFETRQMNLMALAKADMKRSSYGITGNVIEVEAGENTLQRARVEADRLGVSLDKITVRTVKGGRQVAIRYAAGGELEDFKVLVGNYSSLDALQTTMGQIASSLDVDMSKVSFGGVKIGDLNTEFSGTFNKSGTLESVSFVGNYISSYQAAVTLQKIGGELGISGSKEKMAKLSIRGTVGGFSGSFNLGTKGGLLVNNKIAFARLSIAANSGKVTSVRSALRLNGIKIDSSQVILIMAGMDREFEPG